MFIAAIKINSLAAIIFITSV